MLQPTAFVARTMNCGDSTVVGVPETQPFVSSVRPAGRLPLTTLSVPPLVMTMACPYAAPTVPPGRLVVMKLGGPAGFSSTTTRKLVFVDLP